jgi:hypothetical protein
VFKAAREHFGRSSGLRLTEQTLEAVEFASSLGFVRIDAHRTHQGLTDIVITTREHDAEAEAFVFSLPLQGFIDQLRARLRSYRTPSAKP